MEVAPALIGMHLVRKLPGGDTQRFIISETEAYKGSVDEACHARKGLTERNRVMFEQGGFLYMYLIYGIHWMLNVVTGDPGDPQAVLIRGLKDIYGPGRLTKKLEIDGSFYGEELVSSKRIWIENGVGDVEVQTGPRIGIEYAGEYWKNVPWRYFLKE